MDYMSTRGGMAPAPFTEILLGGLAPDGGLTVPLEFPPVSSEELASWRGFDYCRLAFQIISRFATDIPAETLRRLIDKTYTAEVFGSDEITPVQELEPELYLLKLSNGPTLAFKDIAMQFLGQLFSHVLKQRGEALNILGATSGDTGSSAEYAMRGKPNIRVFMLSPYGKMSPFQTAQMFSLQDSNIFNIAVRGVFDDCQDMVKGVSEDAEFKRRYQIGTVNSINWARVVAQVVYYFKAYFAVTEQDGQLVSVSVPSGNFGNIYAGYIAKQMGLPIRRLILACNENNVLDEFFRSGVYRPRPGDQVHKTSSPSMDISKASNFERFVFNLVGRDPAVVRQLWQDIRRQGFFDLNGTPYQDVLKQQGFVSGTSTHTHRMEIIRRVYQDYGMVVDTHTADGIKVGLEYREEGVPLVCAETALPAKFEDAVGEALGHRPERPPGYKNLEQLPQRFEIMDPSVDAIKAYIAAKVASNGA